MAKLTPNERKHLPKKDFAVKGGHYPIEDASHARNALARVSQFGSPSEKATVRAKVHAKYPTIGKSAALKKKIKPLFSSENHYAFTKNDHRMFDSYNRD